jgi:hypothetical protein
MVKAGFEIWSFYTLRSMTQSARIQRNPIKIASNVAFDP